MPTKPANDEILRDELQIVLSAAKEMPAQELPRLLGELEEVRATAIGRLADPAANRNKQAFEPEQLLGVEGAAKRLEVSEDYLYRNWKNLPFAHKYHWGLRFSAREMDEYIRRKAELPYTRPRQKRGQQQ